MAAEGMCLWTVFTHRIRESHRSVLDVHLHDGFRIWRWQLCRHLVEWWSFGPIFHQLLTWLVFNTQKNSWLGLLSQTRKNNIKVAITKLSHFFVD